LTAMYRAVFCWILGGVIVGFYRVGSMVVVALPHLCIQAGCAFVERISP
jgi:hypothetical protein